MKRESLKLQEADWKALQKLAGETNSVYSGQPSWRRLILRLARGEFFLREKKEKKSGSFTALEN